MAGSTNDEVAADALVRRWTKAEAERDTLVRLARRAGLSEVDAEDCVQESILKVVPRADLDEARMGALLATVVKRRAIDLHRRSQAAARASRRLQTIASCETEAADVALCDRAEAEWSATVVDRLPTFQRQVLLARAEGRSWSEIARDLSTSVKAVESAVSRARAAVRVVIASTLGIGLALARRPRQPATIALAATTAIVFIAAVTVPFLHSPHGPDASAPSNGAPRIETVRPAGAHGELAAFGSAAATAAQGRGPISDDAPSPDDIRTDPHRDTYAEVPNPYRDASLYDRDFEPGKDEDDLAHARACVEEGYTLGVGDLRVNSGDPDEAAGYDASDDVGRAGEGEEPRVQGHCNTDLRPS